MSIIDDIINANQHSTHHMKKECSEQVPTSLEYGPLGMRCKHGKTPTRPAWLPLARLGWWYWNRRLQICSSSHSKRRDFESEWILSAVPFELLASIESLGLRELERRLSNFRPKGATAFLGWRGVSNAPGIGKFTIHMATSKHRKPTNQETTNIHCIQTPR